MKIFSDINSTFRKNKTYWIKNLFTLIYKLSNSWLETFKLARTYKTSWLNENSQRKILELLSNHWMLNRHLVFWDTIIDKNSWKVCKKTVYIYEITETFYKILKLFINKLVNKNNYIKLSSENNITEVKTLIKNIYKNTTFKINKYWNHIFKWKWKQLALLKNKRWWVIVNYENYTYDWVEFYSLNIKLPT